MLYTLDPKDSVFIYVNINKHIHFIKYANLYFVFNFQFRGKGRRQVGKGKDSQT